MPASPTTSAPWHGGIAFADNELTIPHYTDRDGTDLQLGGIFKGPYGAHDLTFSASVGRGTFDTRRYVSLRHSD